MRGVVRTGICATIFVPPGANQDRGNMVRQISLLPSVDSLLRAPETEVLLMRFGRTAVTAALRDCLSVHRAQLTAAVPATQIIDEAADRLAVRFTRSQRRVFNMTGTVLHTNL